MLKLIFVNYYFSSSIYHLVKKCYTGEKYKMTFISSQKLVVLCLIVNLLLSGCGFSSTTKKDMDQAQAISHQQNSIAAGHYEEYTPEKLEALMGSEKFALFFHANWCPTCRALEKKLKENLKKLNSRTVLEVNYDTETDLKKKYGITVQSMVVFVNSDGSVFQTVLNPDLELFEKFFH